MLNRLILKVTKFQLPPPKRLGTVVKNILGATMVPDGPPCQIGLKSPLLQGSEKELCDLKWKSTCHQVQNQRYDHTHSTLLRPL